ncbi:hypothetical protein RRG08_063090 [Elysia crispata]|uniref:Uncharacterized protein n=1 Tax=Elysia crispata TaxID=231223 RepID=A0AAE0YL26_9GAST|nr:hypothetical protein RRG08_063090 [Elysia crispata]
METIIIRRRWRWIGHVLRKEQDAIPRVAVQWRPGGHRKRGRPKTTWRRTVEAEAAAMGQSWGTLRMLAQDREQWKEFVAALIAHGKKGTIYTTSMVDSISVFTIETGSSISHTCQSVCEPNLRTEGQASPVQESVKSSGANDLHC